MDDEKHQGAFTKWLLVDKTERHSRMVNREQGEQLIQYLRDTRELGEDDPYMRSNYGSNFRNSVRQKGFKLITVVGLGDILCLPINQAKKNSTETHAMLGQFRQVIFKEDMYDVIHNAHIQGTKHLGYKGTYKKLNETYCCIPRLVVSKFVGLCNFCAIHHSCYTSKNQGDSNQKETVKRQRKKLEFSDAFLTRCQIDIIDMTKNPDGAFSYIGHFFDHHTKYNVLFPLKKKEAAYVARKICRHIIGHFGLPKIIYSSMPRDYIDQLISEILTVWSTDVPIINGDPGNTKALQFIKHRQRTIMILIETLSRKQGNSNAWATWLPCIQYSLNTNEFEQDMPSSCDAVFKARPRSYNYSLSTSQIPREEALMQLSDEDEEQTDNVSEVSQNIHDRPSVVALSAETCSSTLKLSLQNTSVPFGDTSTQEVIPRIEFIPDAERPADLIEGGGVSVMENNPSYATVAQPPGVHQS